ncbi:MAG: protein kinase, partial [Planctomycetota bacterium]
MDAERYSRVRDLFLAAEELPQEQQHDFVQRKCGGDPTLCEEVMSLLAEHDAESARAEGERHSGVTPPLTDRKKEPPADSSPSKPKANSPARDSVGSTAEGVDNHRPSPDGDSSRGAQARKASHGIDPNASSVTRTGAQMTQASPRFHGDRRDSPPGPALPPPKTILWAKQSRTALRQNSWWLLAAAILPTALVGWMTYRTVSEMIRGEVRADVEGLADSIAIATDRFLGNQVTLVQSWSREEQIRAAVTELVEIAKGEEPTQALRAAVQSDQIARQLRYLSGTDAIKFVVWDNTGNTIASWLPNRADVGNPIVQTQANGLARVFRDEAILYGPERLVENTEGFVPETNLPVMAPIVPVHDSKGKVVAAMLVRGFGMFEDFDDVLGDSARSSGVDIYAVNRSAVMVTDSPVAIHSAKTGYLEVPEDQIASSLRIGQPEGPITADRFEAIERAFLPLTPAAARVCQGENGVSVSPYLNYTGRPVVGAWRWMERWQLGVIVEKDADRAFAASRAVRWGFLSLGGLLALTGVGAAGRIARRSAQSRAMLHPLSRYEIMGELGSGGMGVVYRARHRQLGRHAALKVLRGDRRHREDQLRFDREARLAATLSSPHCVKIYDYGSSSDGEAYCVMEYLSGLTLYEVVARSGCQDLGR